MVELVVAGVNDKTGRGIDSQADAIGNGVADMEKVDLEWADLHRFACLDVDQLGFNFHPAPI